MAWLMVGACNAGRTLQSGLLITALITVIQAILRANYGR
jgi:hypothetical protein